MTKASKYRINRLTDEYLFNKNSDTPFDDWYKYSSTDISDDIKYIILNKLDFIERSILLLYIDYYKNGGYQSLAKSLGVSVGTAHAKVKSIKQKILENLR